MRKPIGGFFESEIISPTKGEYHRAPFLNLGRTSLKWILQSARPSKVYVPFYTCNTLLTPMVDLKIPFEFYSITESLEPDLKSSLKENEMMICINYFGIKRSSCLEWINNYPVQVVVDNTQAFFERDYNMAFSFNSARKFFGVPDGAYCYGIPESPFSFEINSEISLKHLEDRRNGLQQQAYNEFLRYESGLNTEIKRGSEYSKKVLSEIDYSEIAEKRRINFKLYERDLRQYNLLKNIDLASDHIPFCYPFIPKIRTERKQLSEKNIFIPVLWREVITRQILNFDFERNLANDLLPLPVDHRYDGRDVAFVIESIMSLNRN